MLGNVWDFSNLGGNISALLVVVTLKTAVNLMKIVKWIDKTHDEQTNPLPNFIEQSDINREILDYSFLIFVPEEGNCAAQLNEDNESSLCSRGRKWSYST